MNYIKQLDSIRALAVILVVTWHWVPRNSFVENLHAGALGVNIFFVLSGFLITQILLTNRKKEEGSITSKTQVLRSFYARRVLRIFPVYYLTVFLTLILSYKLSLEISRNEMLSNITYTSNFFIYITREWPVSSLHFWSLAVEEQFYLAWPLVVLFWPKKTLLPLMLFFIATGLISQLVINDYEFGYLPTYTCLDCFGIGGLLAFIVVHLPLSLQKFYRLLTILSIAVIVVFIVCWNLNFYLRNTRFFHGIVSAWMITYILIYKEKKSLLVSLLNSRLLISIGKVSYGIYLYHILYVYFANKYWYKYVYDHYSAFINKAFEPWIFTVANFSMLYLIAWLSWKFIEKPALSLKRKFQYG